MNKSITTTTQRLKPEAAPSLSSALVSSEDASTDLTAPEHEHSEAVVLAAMWHADQNPAPVPAIPTLCQRFNLTALEACESLAIARRFRTAKKAFQ